MGTGVFVGFGAGVGVGVGDGDGAAVVAGAAENVGIGVSPSKSGLLVASAGGFVMAITSGIASSTFWSTMAMTAMTFSTCSRLMFGGTAAANEKGNSSSTVLLIKSGEPRS